MPCWKENSIYQVFLKYSSIPKDWVHFYIDSCDICQLKATKKFQEALKPIRSKGFLERFQIDLIDMSHEPDARFNWIAHVVDHWGKFHILWPQIRKTAIEVIAGLRRHVFAYFGLPKILQSDNGLEFKNKLMEEEINNWVGDCKLRYGRPRHPQTQGLVEQRNSTVCK